MACHINTIIAVTFPNTCYFWIRRVKCRKTHDITSKPTCKIRLMISETCSSIIAHCIMQINLTHLHSSYIYMLYDVLILNWHGYYNLYILPWIRPYNDKWLFVSLTHGPYYFRMFDNIILCLISVCVFKVKLLLSSNKSLC